MRVARTAGSVQAPSATRTITTIDARRLAVSVRREPEEQVRNEARAEPHGDEGRDGSRDESGDHDHKRATQGLAEDGPAAGAECPADAQFPRPLSDGIRGDSEDAHAGEQEAEQTEEPADAATIFSFAMVRLMPSPSVWRLVKRRGLTVWMASRIADASASGLPAART